MTILPFILLHLSSLQSLRNKSKSTVQASSSSGHINDNKENSKPMHSLSASMMSLDDSNIAFSESSQDGSNSMVSQSMMDTNDSNNIVSGQSGLMLSGGNSEGSARPISTTSPGSNKPAAPNLSAILENS